MTDKIELLLALVDVVFITSIVVAFLIGMAKGIRKTCRTLLGFLPAFLLLIIFVTPICKGIINFDFVPIVSKANEILQLDVLNNLPEKGSLKELILFALNQTGLFTSAVTDSSKLYVLIEGVIVSMVKIFVYYSLLSTVTFIIAPIVRFIIRLVGGKIENKPKIYSRIIGGFIFTAFYLVFIFVWAFPATSGLSICIKYTNAASELAQRCEKLPSKTNNQEEEEYIFDINDKVDKETIAKVKKVADIAGLLDKSVSLKLISVNHTVDTFLFGNMTKVKTDDGAINYVVIIRDTADSLENFIVTSVEEGKVKDWKGFIVLSKELTQVFIANDTIEVFAPIAIEVVENTKINENVEIDLETIKAIDWNKESGAIGDIIVSILDFAIENNIDFNDPLKILENPNLDVSMAKLGKALQNSETITKVLLSAINGPLQDALRDKLGEDSEAISALLEIIDLNKIAENGNWEQDFANLSNVARALYGIGLFSEELDLSNTDAIKRLLSKPFELSFIKGNEETIIKAMIELVNASEFLAEYGITKEKLDLILADINWEEEVDNLSTAVTTILSEVDKYEAEDLKGKIKKMIFEIEEEKLDEILTPIFASKFLIRLVPVILENVLIENDLESLVSEFVKNASNDPSKITKEDYESEKQIIIDAAMIFQTIDFGTSSISIEYVLENAREELVDIASVVIMSKFINRDGMVDLMENVLNDALGYEGEKEIHFEDEVIPQTEEEWKKEFNAVKDLLSEIEGFDFASFDINNQEHIEKIKKIIKALYSSEMLSSVTDVILKNEVIIEVEEAINAELGLEGEDQITINPDNIPSTSDAWNKEIDIIYQIVTDFQNIGEFNFTDEETINKIKSIIDNLYQSDLFKDVANKTLKKVVVKEIESGINSALELETPIEISEELVPTTSDAWNKEIDILHQVLVNVEGISEYDFKDETTITKVKSIITNLYESNLFKETVDGLLKEVVVKEIENGINSALNSETMVVIEESTIPTSSLEWNKEIDLLHKLIVNIELVNQEEFDFDKESDRAILKETLDTICKSQLLSAHLEIILESFIPSLGMDIEIENINFENATSWDYEIEVESLYAIKVILENLQTDASSISSLSNIKEVLDVAADSNIASFILGSQINDSLVSEYAETEEEVLILSKYDFSQKEVMASQKDALNAMLNFGIALGNLKKAIDEENITDEVITNFSDAFAKLSNEDEHYPLVDDLLSLVIKKELESSIDMTPEEFAVVNYPQEAQAFETALLEYRAGNVMDALAALDGSILSVKLFEILL